MIEWIIVLNIENIFTIARNRIISGETFFKHMYRYGIMYNNKLYIIMYDIASTAKDKNEPEWNYEQTVRSSSDYNWNGWLQFGPFL